MCTMEWSLCINGSLGAWGCWVCFIEEDVQKSPLFCYISGDHLFIRYQNITFAKSNKTSSRCPCSQFWC